MLRRQRGVAAVEFGLLIGFLCAICFGMTELGRAFYQYNTLTKATRAAAREFSLGGPSGTTGSRAVEARCVAVYGMPQCELNGNSNPPPILERLTTDMVPTPISVVDTLPGNFAYTYGCVSISGYVFDSLVPWVIPDISFAPIRTCMRQSPI